MGINGALSSAVAGLRAQSHALENISGNIANSQTVGYKRIETDFLDLIPDAPLKSQVAGAVLAQSRGTNNVQGDIRTSTNQTFIALNTNGFLVVEPKTGQADGNSVFAGANFYTRRGDFELDRDGMLVNGAGYYLKGLAVDPTTGNISASVPQIIKISNAFMPANPTRTINYQANLPQLPKTASYNAGSPHSELIKPWTYGNPSPPPVVPTAWGIGLPNPDLQLVPARATGSDMGISGNANAANFVTDGDRLTVSVGGQSYNLWYDTDGVPSSAVEIVGTTTGSDAVRANKRLYIEDSNLADLKTDLNFFIGSTRIPFYDAQYPPTPTGLASAIATALGSGADVYPVMNGYTSQGRIYEIYYPLEISTPDATATGTGVHFSGPGWPAYPANSATTVLNISNHDIVGLHRSAEPFAIGGVPIPFSVPGYEATPADLVRAIREAISVAVPGTDVSSSGPPADFPITITYPPRYRGLDTVAGGSSTSISATGDIDAMLADMQTELRALSGDDTLFVKLKNGRVTVSSGLNDANPLAFSSTRNGVTIPNILGLAPGPHDAVLGTDMNDDNTYADLVVTNSDKLVVTIGDKTLTYAFDSDGHQTPAPGETEIDATGSLANMLAAIQSDLRANGGWGAANAQVSYGANGVQIAFPGNYYYDVSISGSAAEKLDIDGEYAAETGGLPAILASDADRFLSESVAGGAITVYAKNGAPADVQLRWAKIDSATAGGPEQWNLYYLADSKAVGSAPMWMSTGQDYLFGSDGTLIPPGVTEMTISGLSVNGVSIGDVKLQHDARGVSQFADVNGTVSVSTLNQNGYGAGEFQSVAIADNGRVVATYSNGERLDIAQVITAQFSAENALGRLDGGVFQATSASGDPIFDQSGSGVVGGALEASNTDISDEFTKLIVTQQAYSAGTRIISVADQLMKEALNMVR